MVTDNLRAPRTPIARWGAKIATLQVCTGARAAARAHGRAPEVRRALTTEALAWATQVDAMLLSMM